MEKINKDDFLQLFVSALVVIIVGMVGRYALSMPDAKGLLGKGLFAWTVVIYVLMCIAGLILLASFFLIIVSFVDSICFDRDFGRGVFVPKVKSSKAVKKVRVVPIKSDAADKIFSEVVILPLRKAWKLTQEDSPCKKACVERYIELAPEIDRIVECSNEFARMSNIAYNSNYMDSQTMLCDALKAGKFSELGKLIDYIEKEMEKARKDNKGEEPNR